jgi:tight adherence protein B
MGRAVVSLVYVLAFMAMAVAVQGAANIFFESRDRTQRTNRRLTMLASGMDHAEVYAALVRKPVSSATHKFFPLYSRFDLYCRQAGVETSPLKVLSLLGIATTGLWVASLLIPRGGGLTVFLLNALISLPASFLICSAAVWVWLSRRRMKRLKQFEEQMPLALDVVVRALRAGHPVISAIHLAGEEMGDPIGSEFGLIVDETTYGYEFREALTNLARRTGSSHAHFFAVSVAVQTETGGNLAEILEGLANVIRSRGMLAKRVRALSSEGRASAILLSALPALLISFMMLTRPDYYTSKFSDPVFWPIAIVVLLGYLTGLLLIRRIINFRY